MLELAQEEWSTSVKSFPKLRSYFIFKTTLGPEKSVTSLLAQLRSGALPLAIETGRLSLQEKTHLRGRALFNFAQGCVLRAA